MNEKIDLTPFPFFSDISRERLSAIEAVAMVQSYQAGNEVFRNNEPARNLYGVLEGEVALSLLFKEEIVTKDINYEAYISTRIETFERPIIFEHVGEKDLFGWSALVPPQKMTATATCLKDSEIVLIPADRLRDLFNTDPELGYLISSRLNSLIAERLNTRTKKLVEAWCSLFDISDLQTPV